MEESYFRFARCEWRNDVYLASDYSIREGVTSDVPCGKTVATQSVRELARQAGNPLSPSVRARLIIFFHDSHHHQIKLLQSDLTYILPSQRLSV